MNRLEAQRIVYAKAQECIALARRLFPNYTQAAPAIKFELRGRSVGGTALGTRELDFNLDWAMTNMDRFLNIVVPHEVAHIVDEALHPTPAPTAYFCRGRLRRTRTVSHGPTWVRICKALGGDGQRTCSIRDENGERVAKARRTRQYRYLSASGHEVWLGGLHHKRLQARGDILLAGNPIYWVTHNLHGRIYKSGFTNQSRLKA